MNILGIDYGAKRIGLAWVDTALGVVLPFGVIGNQKSEIRNQKLIDLILKQKIESIVIGLPLGLDGKENENTKRVRAFAAELKSHIDDKIEIEFMDERFTTHEAARAGGGVSVDERAAMLILETYVEKMKLDNLEV